MEAASNHKYKWKKGNQLFEFHCVDKWINPFAGMLVNMDKKATVEYTVREKHAGRRLFRELGSRDCKDVQKSNWQDPKMLVHVHPMRIIGIKSSWKNELAIDRPDSPKY